MASPLSSDQRFYVAMMQVGECRICGSLADLRMGVCFSCSDQVDGEKVTATTHKLWDSRNPRNEWYYSEVGH